MIPNHFTHKQRIKRDYVLIIYHFLDDTINIKIFDPNNIKIDEKSYKDTFIYYIGYVAIKGSGYVKINSVNALQLILSKANGYFEEINENMYF